MCGENRASRTKGDMSWWWNKEVKKVMLKKKNAHKMMCGNSIEEYYRYRSINIRPKNVI